VAASRLPVGPVDLHHDLAVGGKEAGQRGAVGPGAFHAPGDGLAEPAGPGEQVLVAGGGSGDLEGSHAAAELVGCVGDMDVQVVSTPTVSWGAVGCGMLVMAVSSAWRGRDGTRAGRADSTARGLGDRLVSGHVRPVGVPVVATARADRSDSRHQAGG